MSEDRRAPLQFVHNPADGLSEADLNVEKSEVIPAPKAAPVNPTRFSLVINKG